MPIPKVCSFESRRETEIAALITKMGGDPFVAPSMREVPLEADAATIEFVAELIAGRVDVVIFLTGVGATALLDAAKTRFDEAEVLDALRKCRVCVRGPKPAAVLKKWDVAFEVRAPEPNTWEDLVDAIDASEIELRDSNVAIQEYGQPNEPLRNAIEARGGQVRSVTVYRWALPEDLGPLEQAITKIAANEFDIVLVTSAQQIRHAVQVAERLQATEAFRSGLENGFLGSIGPTASATLRELEMRVDLEPTHPKMGPLVKESIAAWQSTTQ